MRTSRGSVANSVELDKPRIAPLLFFPPTISSSVIPAPPQIVIWVWPYLISYDKSNLNDLIRIE